MINDPKKFEDECWDEDAEEEGNGAFDGLSGGGGPADAAEAAADDGGLKGEAAG